MTFCNHVTQKEKQENNRRDKSYKSYNLKFFLLFYFFFQAVVYKNNYPFYCPLFIEQSPRKIPRD